MLPRVQGPISRIVLLSSLICVPLPLQRNDDDTIAAILELNERKVAFFVQQPPLSSLVWPLLAEPPGQNTEAQGKVGSARAGAEYRQLGPALA